MPVLTKAEVEYPVSDGKPMAESAIHMLELMAIFQVLDFIFENRDDVLVAANNFVYYVEGNPRKCFSPDIYIVFGVPKGARDSFKIWQEGGHVPSFVLELTSAGTKYEDTVLKKRIYAELGVSEYFLFDPKSEYLHSPLAGYRLKDGQYVPIERDTSGCLYSEVVKHNFRVDNRRLNVLDPKSGSVLPRIYETAKREAENAKREAKARRAAEDELERVKAELKRLKKS